MSGSAGRRQTRPAWPQAIAGRGRAARRGGQGRWRGCRRRGSRRGADVLVRGVPRARDANPRTGAREGPVAGGGGGGGAGGEASPGEDGTTPEPRLEGDASGVEADEPGEGASPGEEGAAPELRLEGDAGGVEAGVGAGVGVGVGVGSSETWLEGDPEGGEAAPKPELKGAAENDEAVPESELEGTAAGGPAGGRRRGPSVVEGGVATTCLCAKGKQCSSKYTCREVMTR
nr:glycine-rich cell wall structural protein 2-like [Lolium perenne]